MSDAIVRARVLSTVRGLSTDLVVLRTLETARARVGEIPPHRLNQLATSFAWHAERRGPDKRLEEGAREISRLWGRVGEHAPHEQELYLLLGRNLGIEFELHQVQQRLKEALAGLENTATGEPDPRKRRQIEREQRPRLRELHEEEALYGRVLKVLNKVQGDNSSSRPWLEQIVPQLKLPADQLERWRPELRLRLALAAVQTVQTLQATAELQRMVEAKQEGVFPWR